MGQSLRCRHDGIDRVLLRLLCHARLRRPPDARDQFSLSAILPAERWRAHRTNRHPAGASRPPRRDRSRLGRRCPDQKRDGTHLAQAQAHYAKARRQLDELAAGTPGRKLIHPQHVAKAISDRAADDAIFTCDVGLPTVLAARYLAMNGKRRLLGSFWHGSMANAMAGALGFIELEQKSTGFLDFGTELRNPEPGSWYRRCGSPLSAAGPAYRSTHTPPPSPGAHPVPRIAQ
jgi:hypothetical protein